MFELPIPAFLDGTWRAPLTVHEGVRVLVPLDEAKRALRRTAYCIRKHPPGRGLEADWIALDDRGRLVVAETKGSFDKAVRTWSGPDYRPDVLQNAIDQAGRTAVFRDSKSTPLPAKRWAVASRWANEANMLDPTLLAWDPDEGELKDRDYRELARRLHRADIEGVLKALGHPQAVGIFDAPEATAPVPGALRLRVGPLPIEPGFAALVGPVGIHTLREHDDLDRVQRIREMNPQVALASLSSRYARAVVPLAPLSDETGLDRRPETAPDPRDRLLQRAGLTALGRLQMRNRIYSAAIWMRAAASIRIRFLAPAAAA